MEIQSTEDLEYAASVLKEVKANYKDLEERRKKATQPMNAALKEVRSWFKPATDHWSNCEKTLKIKIGRFHHDQETKRREALRQAQEAVKSGTTKEVKEALAEVTKTEEPEIKGLSTRKIWDFSVEDVDEIPREFMVPDLVKIRKHIQEHKGEMPIKGINAFQKTVVSSSSLV